MRSLIVVTALASSAALGQTHDHLGHTMSPSASVAAEALPDEGGQAAFASIAEVVALLDADPSTDWGKVNIDALRAHLVDMDNVTLHARVATTPVDGGASFAITGDGEVRASIRRMTASHAGMVNVQDGQQVAVREIPEGVTMTVTSSDRSRVARIRALGFFGLMTEGVHHQLHHLMMAKGTMHH